MSWFSSAPETQPDHSALEAKHRAEEAILEAKRAEAAAREARLRAEKARAAAEAALLKNTPTSDDPYYAQRQAGKPTVHEPISEGAATIPPALSTPDESTTRTTATEEGVTHGGGWNPMNLFHLTGAQAESEQRDTRAAEEMHRQAAEAARKEEASRQDESGKSVWNMLNVFQKPEEQAAAEKLSTPEQTEIDTAQEPALQTQVALVETEKGNIAFELYPEEAPQTVANFVKLVNDGFYNKYNMKFHRVIPGFVVQTGDPTGTGAGGSKTHVPLEAKNKLTHNTKGIVAMARGADPNSASSQFYITLAPQTSLDGKYAIFGKVISGMDVLDKIEMGDMLYGVRLVSRTAIKLDAQPEKKTMFSWLH